MSHLYKNILFFCIAHILTGCFVIRKHNEEHLEELAENRVHFDNFIQRVHEETDCFVYITSGFRTLEKQKILYKQNNKNAKPGTSPHEHSIAIDINLICNGDWIVKKDSKETWEETNVPQIAKELGFRWGGNFKYYHDPVHFEIEKKYKIKQ
jgi:peptidoglycan LD-endopeptidase CwlK